MIRSQKRGWTIVPLVLIVALAAGPSCGMAQHPAAPPDTGIVAPSGEPAETVRPSPVGPVSTDYPAASPRRPDSERRAGLPHDLSPWGMFMSADWVVKAVMIGLAFASLVTWTVGLAKTVEVVCARARARRTTQVIASSESLADADRALANRGGPTAFMVRSAGDELRRSSRVLDHAGDGGVKERVASRLARIEAQAGRRLTRGTGLLATIGATAPFVGLFGTVWGIMNAFIGISQTQTTNLAVVAPGIAEALLTTAFGLVAAVPAVVIYNAFARAVAGYRQGLADAAAAVERLVSLDLDVRKVPDARAPAPSVLAAE
ncbi:tonB-system energizer ExbB [Bradyrhizobium sp. BRP22]|uniref:tonB-system energizer ExbB n=1 Tax=Bradyrhizobium sp. BRP22 TaxID=2793821 RepID=UPI001CD630F6|nr:tonB-system energizer ExbB [Bradyrhizobium sp. BRP22]MCA1454618.1 tonB-system energizer ExbB [Bradyrhizobium sp. BRP22]